MLKDIEEADTRYNYIVKKITFVIRMLSQQGIWFIIKKENIFGFKMNKIIEFIHIYTGENATLWRKMK